MDRQQDPQTSSLFEQAFQPLFDREPDLHPRGRAFAAPLRLVEFGGCRLQAVAHRDPYGHYWLGLQRLTGETHDLLFDIGIPEGWQQPTTFILDGVEHKADADLIGTAAAAIDTLLALEGLPPRKLAWLEDATLHEIAAAIAPARPHRPTLSMHLGGNVFGSQHWRPSG